MSKATELIRAEQWFKEVMERELNALHAEYIAARLAAQKLLTEQYNARVKEITEKYAPVNTPPSPWGTTQAEKTAQAQDTENKSLGAWFDEMVKLHVAEHPVFISQTAWDAIRVREQRRLRQYAQWFSKWLQTVWFANHIRVEAIENWADLFDQFDKAVKEGWKP